MKEAGEEDDERGDFFSFRGEREEIVAEAEIFTAEKCADRERKKSALTRTISRRNLVNIMTPNDHVARMITRYIRARICE